MELSLLILQNLLAKGIVCGVGYASGRLKIAGNDAGRFISAFTLYFTGPCALLSSFLRNFDPAMMRNFGVSAIGAFCIYIFFVCFSRLICRIGHFGNTFEASIIFSNNGSFIVAVINALLGSEYVFYLSAFIVVHQLMFFTYGVMLLTKEKKIQIKSVFNPNILAVLIGMMMFIFSIPVPEVIKTVISDLGNMHGTL